MGLPLLAERTGPDAAGAGAPGVSDFAGAAVDAATDASGFAAGFTADAALAGTAGFATGFTLTGTDADVEVATGFCACAHAEDKQLGVINAVMNTTGSVLEKKAPQRYLIFSS